MTERWGITIPFDNVPLPEQRELIEQLPDLGYTDVWSAETNGTDAFTGGYVCFHVFPPSELFWISLPVTSTGKST